MLSNKITWQPLTPDQIGDLLKTLSARWWIAGGFALDLFLGRKIREHLDIDILILRDDQLKFQSALNSFELFKTGGTGLQVWENGEFLPEGINSIWCRKKGEASFAMELLQMDSESDRWVYRRAPEIGGLIKSLGYKTDKGLPYLRPEIQLLYKANQKTKEKDKIDFEQVAPSLNNDSQKWLSKALSIQFPEGHKWIEQLREYHAGVN